jgi:anti-sigma factor RsiW
MTCHECCEMIDRLTDEGLQADRTNEALRGHLETCANCHSYSVSMTALDASLRTLPLPEPTEEFLRSLSAIAEQEDVHAGFLKSWRRELIRAGVLLIPCAALWAGAESFPLSIQVIINVVFASAGIAALLAVLLKPRMVSC